MLQVTVTPESHSPVSRPPALPHHLSEVLSGSQQASVEPSLAR